MPKKNNEKIAAEAGQLFVVGFDGTDISGNIRPLLTQVQPAGVILFGRNIVSAKQTHQLLKDCQSLVSEPLFTCVDMEGGRVDRFRNLNGGSPSAADVFATGDRKLFRKHGKVIGGFCRAFGFNTDFAPVLDLALEVSRTVMSSRAVSDDPRLVAAYGKQFLAGLRDAGVLGCGKHFPGLGEGNLDSHDELPIIDKSSAKLWEEDMLPYRLLRAQMPLVLVSHAGYPGITRDNGPASLSKKIISGVLRKRIGYKGLVASDDMEMGAVLKTVSIEEAAIAHIRAGGDLCLICRREDLIVQAYEAVIEEAHRSRQFAAQVADASRRVARLKKKLWKSIRWRFPSVLSQSKLDHLSYQLTRLNESVRPNRIQVTS